MGWVGLIIQGGRSIFYRYAVAVKDSHSLKSTGKKIPGNHTYSQQADNRPGSPRPLKKVLHTGGNSQENCPKGGIVRAESHSRGQTPKLPKRRDRSCSVSVDSFEIFTSHAADVVGKLPDVLVGIVYGGLNNHKMPC